MINFIKELVGVFVPRILAENIIKANEDTYYHCRKKWPNQNEHDYLAMTYAARRRTHVKVFKDNITEEQIHILSYTETEIFSVLVPPKSIRALALYILYKERPDLITDNHHDEYSNLIGPVLKSQDDGSFENWYKKTNPDKN